MVLREAVTLAGIGVVIGCACAVAMGRWTASLLFETAPSDPIVLASVAGVMLTVAVGATLLPARTASKSDPSVLLKVQ